jgi:CDGSH iron-sulfur domain-containing protein 3
VSTTIRLRENGPIVVEGDDVVVVDWNGRAYAFEKRPIALCRCGQSAKKPLCDGTHRTCGFVGNQGAVPSVPRG